ncbi:MAG: hypothetical protein CMO81_12485 [Waddliaceae bacterium]|nr:hypothetical protein [Waddliaceae bacterium]
MNPRLDRITNEIIASVERSLPQEELTPQILEDIQNSLIVLREMQRVNGGSKERDLSLLLNKLSSLSGLSDSITSRSLFLYPKRFFKSLTNLPKKEQETRLIELIHHLPKGRLHKLNIKKYIDFPSLLRIHRSLREISNGPKSPCLPELSTLLLSEMQKKDHAKFLDDEDIHYLLAGQSLSLHLIVFLAIEAKSKKAWDLFCQSDTDEIQNFAANESISNEALKATQNLCKQHEMNDKQVVALLSGILLNSKIIPQEKDEIISEYIEAILNGNRENILTLLPYELIQYIIPIHVKNPQEWWNDDPQCHPLIFRLLPLINQIDDRRLREHFEEVLLLNYFSYRLDRKLLSAQLAYDAHLIRTIDASIVKRVAHQLPDHWLTLFLLNKVLVRDAHDKEITQRLYRLISSASDTVDPDEMRYAYSHHEEQHNLLELDLRPLIEQLEWLPDQKMHYFLEPLLEAWNSPVAQGLYDDSFMKVMKENLLKLTPKQDRFVIPRLKNPVLIDLFLQELAGERLNEVLKLINVPWNELIPIRSSWITSHDQNDHANQTPYLRIWNALPEQEKENFLSSVIQQRFSTQDPSIRVTLNLHELLKYLDQDPAQIGENQNLFDNNTFENWLLQNQKDYPQLFDFLSIRNQIKLISNY